MKNVLIFLVIISSCFACNNDDDTETTPPEEVEVSLLGTWLFVARRSSDDTPPFPEEDLPFVDVESTNTVTFFTDNIITSNARSLCANYSIPGNPTSGLYSMLDSTYTSSDCGDPDYNYSFTQTDSILVISYPYLGLSEAKFKKIADLE